MTFDSPIKYMRVYLWHPFTRRRCTRVFCAACVAASRQIRCAAAGRLPLFAAAARPATRGFFYGSRSVPFISGRPSRGASRLCRGARTTHGHETLLIMDCWCAAVRSGTLTRQRHERDDHDRRTKGAPTMCSLFPHPLTRPQPRHAPQTGAGDEGGVTEGRRPSGRG